MLLTFTSDVLIYKIYLSSIDLLCMQFSRYIFDSLQNQVENTRVELVTSCLQGRRSPN